MKITKILLLLLSVLLFNACEEEDDVATSTGIVDFTISEIREVENATQALSFNIGVDQPNHTGGTVVVSIAGGEYGSDYETSEGSASFPVTIEANSLISTFSISLIDNDIIEGNKELTITLSQPTGGLALGENVQIDFTIIDNDDPLLALVSFENPSTTVNENDTTATPIAIALSTTSTDGGTITIEATGDAVAGVDYTVDGGSDSTFVVTISPGANSASFDFLPIDNTDFEADKTVNFVITEVTGGLSLGAALTHDVTIVNDDVALNPFVDFDGTNITSAGEDVGDVVVNLVFSEATTEVATVTITASGNATIGDDYTIDGATNTTFDIAVPVGVTSASVTLQIIDDMDTEDAEDIVLDITNVTGGLVAGVTQQQNTLTIVDNDSSSTLIDYLETFEGFDGTSDYLTTILMYYSGIVDQTIDPNKINDVIENAGNFSDPTDPTLPSDKGLNMFYNSMENPTNFGLLDNVVITRELEGTGTIDITVDNAYAFKNQNSGVVTYYFSETYDGSGNFDESQWTVMGTEDVATMDGEGFGNNDYKREEFTITTSSNFYIAIRVTQTIDATSYRTRWRFDNITAVSQ